MGRWVRKKSFKATIFFTVWVLLLFFSLPRFLNAYDNIAVHPWITEQAFFVWPNDRSHEIWEYLGLGYRDGSNFYDSCATAGDGKLITEGAKEEDNYNPIMGLCTIDINNPPGIGWYHHFYDPDVDSSNNGLCNATGALAYAFSNDENADTYWKRAKSFYLAGVQAKKIGDVGLERINKGTAYWYIGRVAHLLADVSVPAHVHRDAHIYNKDSYEKYTELHYTNWTYVHAKNLPNADPSWTVDDLFMNLAQRSQYFPSDDNNGNVSNTGDWFDGWPVNPNGMREGILCIEEGSTDICSENPTWCSINDSNLFKIGDKLMPLAIQYTAALYRLFWIETHPVNPTIAMTPMSGPPGTTFAEWGTGFTPYGTATLHFRKPDGTEYPTLIQHLDSIGHFDISYAAPIDKPVGVHTWWAIDDTTRVKSNEVSYVITAQAPGSLTVYDFWKKADPIYADPSSDAWHPNFDAQYKVRNSGSKPILIERLALAIHDSNNKHLWDMLNPSTGQPRYYDNFTLNPGETKYFEYSVDYFRDPGSYRVVAKAKINGVWYELAYLDIIVQPRGKLTVYDFWKKADPIYADPSSDAWHPNFDAQYKVRNSGSKPIFIQRLALAIHDSNNKHLWDMLNPSTGQPRYYDNFTLNPGETKYFEYSVDYFRDPGNYRVVAKAKTGGVWNELVYLDVRVIAGQITVLSPNGDESWEQGSQHKIRWVSNGNIGSNVKIELYKGGSKDKTIKSSTSNDGSYTWDVSDSQKPELDYRIKITSTSNSSYSDFSDSYFTITAKPPSKATNPVPGNGATNIPINTSIKWSNGGGAQSYYVYFGTNGSLSSRDYKGTLSGTSFSPGTLAYNTTYYWRIDSINAGGITTGDVWHFRTESSNLPPGSVFVNPMSGTWTSSPQDINVGCSDASQIYYTISYTLDESTPADPPEPTTSVNDGSISGNSGTFQVFATVGQYKTLKVRFRGYNDVGYGPTSSSYLYTIDLRGGSTGLIQLPQTGQTKCYDSVGTEISCTGTGQDGEIRAGVPWPNPRFIDNYDGTVADTLTGLVWLKDANCIATQYPDFDNDVANGGLPGDGRVTWQHALDFVTGMNNGTYQNCGAEYSDWRLPNVVELESLINFGGESQNIYLTNNWFKNVYAQPYWSSTVDPSNPTAYSMYVGFDDGRVYYCDSGLGGWWCSNEYVWPVRSGPNDVIDANYSANIWKTGQTTSYSMGDDGDLKRGITWPDPRFTDNLNGTVTDNLTGLMWLKDANCISSQYPSFDNDINVDNNEFAGDGRITWEHARDFVSGINEGTYLNCGAGYADWRLPNRKELYSLISYSYSLTLPEGHPFGNVGFWYWSSSSSSTASGDAFSAWFVNMGNGSVIKSFRDRILVWPVRGGTINPMGPTWVLKSTLHSPPPRGQGGMVYDSNRNHIVLFGGYGTSECCLNDTWEYDGTDWIQIHTNNSPPGRFVFSMAFDSARKRTVLFGGASLSSTLNDTWEYDGTNWVQKFPTDSPHIRYMHDMVYDSSRGVIVLFGGTWYDGQQGHYLGDTWEYDGVNWVQKTPESSPSARAYHTMAFDTDREQTVLIGGLSIDWWQYTWEYDGTNWVQKTPTNSPPYRYYHDMEYSTGLKRTVLFGATTSSSPDHWSNDTWEYDGTDWIEANPENSPHARIYPHMAYDNSRGCIVLFGGQLCYDGSGCSGFVNDTWEYCVH